MNVAAVSAPLAIGLMPGQAKALPKPIDEMTDEEFFAMRGHPPLLHEKIRISGTDSLDSMSDSDLLAYQIKQVEFLFARALSATLFYALPIKKCEVFVEDGWARLRCVLGRANTPARSREFLDSSNSWLAPRDSGIDERIQHPRLREAIRTSLNLCFRKDRGAFFYVPDDMMNLSVEPLGLGFIIFDTPSHVMRQSIKDIENVRAIY